MLPSKKDILKSSPPFLMKHLNSEWSLVIDITDINGILKLDIVDMNKSVLNQRVIKLTEQPFYVGEDVWELDYGSVLMTLNHPSLLAHPARKIWGTWLACKNSDD